MSSIDGKTSIKIDELVNNTIISGRIVDGQLLLTTRGGAEFNAGFVGGDVPAGVIVQYGGNTEPPGWLFPDGRELSRITFAALFAKIGTIHGAGDGSTTFNLPNYQGRVPVGPGTATGANGATLHVIGDKGGEETHVITLAESAPHRHEFKIGLWDNNYQPAGPNAAMDFDAGAYKYSTGSYAGGSPGTSTTKTRNPGGSPASGSVTKMESKGDTDVAITTTGGSATAANNMQPFIVVPFLIRTGASGEIGSDGSARTASTPVDVTVPANSRTNVDLPLSKSYRILSLTVNHACRVRLYATAANRTADAARPIGTDPTDGTGVMLDFNATAAGTFNLSPLVDGANMETVPTSTISALVDNLTSGSLTVNVSFVYQVTER